MVTVFKHLYLTRWFFVVLTSIILVYVLAYVFPVLVFWGNVLFASLMGLTLLDILLLFSVKHPIEGIRHVQKRLNLGDANRVEFILVSRNQQPLHFTLIEGYPVEMQERSAFFSGILPASGKKSFVYSFTPKSRGIHLFGEVFVFLRSMFFLASRRIVLPMHEEVHVFPSVMQMKKYELLVFQQQKTASGIKRIRRLGNNSEFEQIKNYVQGDELKAINWKATSRKNELMVNQYQEEKAQNVYCIIDKGRSMQMEFDGLSLLDYAINTSLVVSNIALKKGDRAGLITYADKIGSLLPAERSAGQMRRIHETLYNQRTLFKEANFESVYQSVRRTVRARSLLVLFTNFETEFAMRRAIPYLRRLNQKHIVVVVFFENTELQELAFRPATSTLEVYQASVAEKMISVKANIARELGKNGIQALLTPPSDLSINSINKYLEIKAKGAI